MKTQNIYLTWGILLLTAEVFSSCETSREVAVTSFKVLDAPANYIRHQIDESEQTTTTTVTTTSNTVDSDYQRRGQPIATDSTSRSSSQPVSTQRRVAAETASPDRTPRTARVSTERAQTHTHATAPPKPVVAVPSDLPSGKPVPGKPGYVYSPYDPNGGYVDVTGFTSGSKVKDPYSNRIFLVP